MPTENLRFREESLTFKLAESAEDIQASKHRRYTYPKMTKTLGKYPIHVLIIKSRELLVNLR